MLVPLGLRHHSLDLQAPWTKFPHISLEVLYEYISIAVMYFFYPFYLHLVSSSY